MIKTITEVCFDLLVNEIKEEIVLRICIWILTLILQCDIYFKESHKDGRNQCLLPREDLATLTTKKNYYQKSAKNIFGFLATYDQS